MSRKQLKRRLQLRNKKTGCFSQKGAFSVFHLEGGHKFSRSTSQPECARVLCKLSQHVGFTLYFLSSSFSFTSQKEKKQHMGTYFLNFVACLCFCLFERGLVFAQNSQEYDALVEWRQEKRKTQPHASHPHTWNTIYSCFFSEQKKSEKKEDNQRWWK